MSGGIPSRTSRLVESMFVACATGSATKSTVGRAGKPVYAASGTTDVSLSGIKSRVGSGGKSV